MRVLLRFGDAKLRLAALRKVFAHRHRQLLRRERNSDVRHRLVVGRHRDVAKREEAVSALEARKTGIDERARDLARAIGTEIEENDGIVSFNCAVLVYHGRDDEFVRHAVCVGILHGLDRAIGDDPLAVDERRVRLIDAIPREIPVHRVVSARKRGYFA